MTPLLTAQNLFKTFHLPHGVKGRQTLYALDDVSLTLNPGETLGIVGESGSGKSTLARTLLRLYQPDSGTIELLGTDITALGRKQMMPLRRHIQMVFQDPYASLNPRMTIESTLLEPLAIAAGRGVIRMTGQEMQDRVTRLLEMVGLSPEFRRRYPHEFSGGQRQRIGIARALALSPQIVLLDEPVSALDVSIQAQILNLLKDLKIQEGLTYLFISHDLGVVRHICTRVSVMYLGRIVETAATEDLFNRPLHPYTRALLSDIPLADPAAEKARVRMELPGEIPSPAERFTGCRFAGRCYLKTDLCLEKDPLLEEHQNSHFSACHHWNQVGGKN